MGPARVSWRPVNAPIVPNGPRIGHDLVDVARLTRAIEERPERWQQRIFTEAEWERAQARPDTYAVLAARFAAKEAAFKALGTGWGKGVAWRDVEVIGGGRTAPSLSLRGVAAEIAEKGKLQLLLSISHTDELASAVVMALPR